VLSVLWYTDSVYPLGIFWPLCCLFFYDLQILITPLVSNQNLYIIEEQTTQWPKKTQRGWSESVYHRRTDNTIAKRYQGSNQNLDIIEEHHCVVCSSMIYRFWLPTWYLLAIVLSVLWYTDSVYPLGIFWPLCCLFFESVYHRRTDNTMAKRYHGGNQNLYIIEE
jgi:hypothetical protein